MKLKLFDIYREEAGGDGDSGAGGSAGDGGNGDASSKQISGENWREFIPEDLQDNDVLAKFTTIEGLAKSYINAESMIGQDKIVLPKTDEEWNDVYGKLGRPETSDDYGFEYGENEGKDPISVGFRETVHKLGLNVNQAKGLFGWYNETMTAAKEQNESEAKDKAAEVELGLKNEWGEKYKGNFQLAKRTMETFGDDDFKNFLEESGLGNDPNMIRFLHKVGTQAGEDNLEDGDGDGIQTPEQLQEEINTVMATSAYQDKTDPNHNITVKKVQQLYERLYKPAA